MIKQYRKQWLKRHAIYERSARIIFQRAFKNIANDIPFDKITKGTYEDYIISNVSEGKIIEAYKTVYLNIGLTHGKRVGREINKQINKKDFTLDGFISEFEKNITRWLIDNGAQRIRTVRSSYISFIKELIARGLAEDKTISQIATDMQKLIKSRKFYRWQSLRIARTETTTASNYASSLAGETSGVLMQKVWISALDVRTRRKPDDLFDHYEMNEKRVALKDTFSVSGENILYPGDPKASAGNIINCRCTIAQVVKRDSNGNIIRVPSLPNLLR